MFGGKDASGGASTEGGHVHIESMVVHLGGDAKSLIVKQACELEGVKDRKIIDYIA